MGNMKLHKKYEKNLLLQSCINNDIELFNQYQNLFNDNVIIKHLYLSLRHANVEIAEHIISSRLSGIDLGEVSRIRYLGSIRRNSIIKVINSIQDENKTPNLYKIRGVFLQESIEYFWRRNYFNELNICLNELSKSDRTKIISTLLKKGRTSEIGYEMMGKLKTLVREDIINEILE